MRRKNDDGNVRKRGRPKIRWLDGERVIPKRRDCQGGSVRPSYIIRRTSTHKTVGLKCRIFFLMKMTCDSRFLELLVLAMLFREAAEVADGLVSSCGNPTDIRSIVSKRPQADVTNAI